MIKRLITVVLFSAFAAIHAAAQAQPNRFPPINLIAGDLTGTPCQPNSIAQSSTSGVLYTCQGGTYHMPGGQTFPSSGVIWPPECNTPGMAYNPASNTCINTNAIPPANIVWPPECNAPGMVYNIATNTCTDISHVPPTAVTWPPSCTGGTYVPASNTCVPTGTAANPGGATTQVQYNAGSTFAGDAAITINNTTHTLGSQNVSASTNAVLYVKAPPYNAKCDGTTDDQAAIQAAFNDAKPGSTNPLCTVGGCSVQFPAGRCLTSTVTWIGQSFFGAGRDVTYIRGKPGQDIFQVPDTTGTFIGNGFVHDFSLEIDVTVNAASTVVGGSGVIPGGNPANRIAGTWQGTTAFNVPIAPGAPVFGQTPCASPNSGASALAGGTTVTVTAQCGAFLATDLLIDPALVNNTPITIQGAGASGGLYTGTILSLVADGVQTVTGSGTPSGMTPGTYPLAFSGGGGSGAAGTITVSTATAYTIQVTVTGAGYTTAPTVTATGTGGTPPTLTATIGKGCGGHSGVLCGLNVDTAISTAVTKAPGTFLAAHTPPWYIGNAGFALQCSNLNTCYGNAIGTRYSNIAFRQFGSSLLYMNHAAGIFSQMPFYEAHFDNLHFFSLYGGLIEAVSPTTGSTPWTSDTAAYKDINFSNDLLPIVTYNGNDRVLSGINVYQETPLSMGPFFLTRNQTTLSGNATWTIDSFYEEGGSSTAGEYARFMSGPYFVTASNLGGGNSTTGTGGGSWIEFTSGGGTNWYGTISGAIHIDASNLNTFINAAGTLYDNGLGNKSEGHYGIPNLPFLGRKFYDPNAKPPRSTVGLIDGSFLLSGNASAPYLNASDLVTTCEDWPVVLNPASSGGAAGTCVNDPTGTELTRHYYRSNGPTTVLSLVNNNVAVPAYAWSGTPRTLGTNFPQSRINVIVMARCVGAGCAATIPFRLKDATTGVYLLPNPALTLSLTSAWSQQSAAFDLTGTTYGHVMDFRTDSITNTGTNYDIAYVAFQPIPTDFAIKGVANLTTAAIAAGQCGTTVTVPASGVTTSDAILYSYAAVVTANPGTLIVNAWPTANNVNFNYCNPTSASVTPSSAVLNWAVRK